MAFGALPALWGTTSGKQNILFVGTAHDELSTLDQRLIKAIKTGDVLVLENTSPQGMDLEINQFFKEAQKPISTLALPDEGIPPPLNLKIRGYPHVDLGKSGLPQEDAITKANQRWLDRLLKIIKDNPGKKIVVAIGLKHYDHDKGLLNLLKKHRFTFTSFEAIPLWPVYIPHSHYSPPFRAPKKPYKGAQIDKLETIMPPRVPNPPLPPMPPIAKQPLTGLGSPFAREHFHHYKK